MVLSRIAASADHGGIVAGRPHSAPGLLFGGDGRSPVRAAEIARTVCPIMGRAFRRMGWIPDVPRRSAVLYPRLPVGEAPNPVAAAQPADRPLHLYRRDS